MRTWPMVLAISTTACLRTTEFKCQTSDQCGTDGVCEPVGYCSLPDPSCGQRFVASAGPYAGQCVGGPGGTDGGVDGPVGMVDASIDAPPGNNCPSGYNPLTGAPHRYKLITTSGQWAAQQTACAATSPAAYLAIPDDLAELTALDTLAGANALYWVGIDDMTTEGTYVTVKGAAATFLPWALGQPDNLGPGGGQDCEAAITATAKIEDDRCNQQHVAICECEP